MHRRAFTLIELLVVVGIVAIIAIVVVFVVNPGEILRKSRDSVRLSDLKVIDGMVSAYQQAVGGSLGSSSVTYVSIPDPTATSSAGTDCTGLGAPFTGGGAFHCAASSTLRKVDGTGWIPVNLAAAPDGLSIGALPVDPVNTTSSNQYYLYQTDGSTYEIKALPESQTYTATAATNAKLFARGTNLALIANTYLSQFGSRGSGNGQFVAPYGIAIDKSGNIYVTDTNNNRVQKFNSGGTYLSQFGSSGSGNGQFNDPLSIAIDGSGNIYVVDAANNRVQEFDSGGTYLSQFGSSGSGNGQFNVPLGIAIDASGNIYVTDWNNNRVQKFNSGGTYLSQFGSSGSGNGQFSGRPYGIAIDASGNIYVTDTSGLASDPNRVQKFNSGGTYLSQFGSSGSGNGQFDSLFGIAIDASGNIYATDSGNYRVEEFNSSGGYLSQFGTGGTGNGQFNAPRGIAIDGSGNIYVVDDILNNIQKFEGTTP